MSRKVVCVLYIVTFGAVTVITPKLVNPRNSHVVAPLANNYSYLVVSNEVTFSCQEAFPMKSPPCFNEVTGLTYNYLTDGGWVPACL